LKQKKITHLEVFHLMEKGLASLYEVELRKIISPGQRFRNLFSAQYKGGKVC
jgi:hypothetical protein